LPARFQDLHHRKFTGLAVVGVTPDGYAQEDVTSEFTAAEVQASKGASLVIADDLGEIAV